MNTILKNITNSGITIYVGPTFEDTTFFEPDECKLESSLSTQETLVTNTEKINELISKNILVRIDIPEQVSVPEQVGLVDIVLAFMGYGNGPNEGT